MDEAFVSNIEFTGLGAVRDPMKAYRERALMLWRVLARQPEVRSGMVRVHRDPFLRSILNDPQSGLAGDERVFRARLKQLLFGASPDAPVHQDTLTLRVYIQLEKELSYAEGRRDQFSFDIMFQTIELLSLGKTAQEAEHRIRSIGMREDDPLATLDRDRLLLYFRVYNFAADRIQKAGSIRTIVEKREQIVDDTAHAFPETPLSAIDSMFRYCLAQILLSRKFICGQLIQLWAEEYGFDDDAILRVKRFIPEQCSLLEFRARYARGIQAMRSGGAEDLDIFYLRTLANYFTSWVMNVSEKLPA